jgi:hypothetical protein
MSNLAGGITKILLLNMQKCQMNADGGEKEYLISLQNKVLY